MVSVSSSIRGVAAPAFAANGSGTGTDVAWVSGAWYEENGRYAAAIDHYIDGEQFDQAAKLILQEAEGYLMRSEVDTLLE